MGLESLNSRDVVGRFYERLDEQGGEVPSWVESITWRNDTNKEEEIYRFLGHVPRMSKWGGSRIADKPRIFEEIVRNEVYDASMEITVDEIRRELTGQIDIRIGELAVEPSVHMESLVTDTIIAGTTAGTSFDGDAFWSDSHQWGDATGMDNNLGLAAASGTTPTVDEFVSGIMAQIKAIYGFKDDRNRPINRGARSFQVMVPIALWDVAQKALNDQYISNGVTNSLQGVMRSGVMIDIVANPYLTSDVEFYLFRTDGMLAPFILQIEQPANLQHIAEGSEMERLQRKHVYTVEGIHGIGYGYWPYAVKTTIT